MTAPYRSQARRGSKSASAAEAEELRLLREHVINDTVGMVWIAAIFGGISTHAAERLARELRQAAVVASLGVVP